MSLERDDDFLELDAILDGAPMPGDIIDADFTVCTSGLTALGIAAKSAPVPPRPARDRKPPGRPLYFDLETIPDYSRLAQFGLGDLPQPKPAVPLAQCPAVNLTAMTVAQVETLLAGWTYPSEWLSMLEVAELGQKNRKGVLDAIKSARQADAMLLEAAAERSKLLSVTPEFCQIAALGWADSEGQADSLVLGEEHEADGGELWIVTEAHLIEEFWILASKFSPVVGFNVLGFDLPVLFIRSMLLGIEPTKRFDTRPWGSDVVDLMALRFAKGRAMKLKDLARFYGIEIPCPDVDGAKVEELMRAGEFGKVGEYVESDVWVSREIHRMYSGYFCP